MRAFLFATLLLAACATPAAPAAGADVGQNAPLETRIRTDNERLDRELRADGIVSAGIGETADLGNGLTVKPLEVLEDSRCPADVTCIWAGRLRLRAEVSGVERELIAYQPSETSQGTLTLAIVKPGAWASWPNSRPPYRFGFRRG